MRMKQRLRSCSCFVCRASIFCSTKWAICEYINWIIVFVAIYMFDTFVCQSVRFSFVCIYLHFILNKHIWPIKHYQTHIHTHMRARVHIHIHIYMHTYVKKARKNVKVYPTALLVGIGDNNEAEAATTAAATKRVETFLGLWFSLNPFLKFLRIRVATF